VVKNNDTETFEAVCICEKGFEFVREGGVGKCVDIDECARREEKNLCSPHSQCVNDMGSFHCDCIDGR